MFQVNLFNFVFSYNKITRFTLSIPLLVFPTFFASLAEFIDLDGFVDVINF